MPQMFGNLSIHPKMVALVAVRELQEERVRAVAWAAGEGGQGELGARRRRVDSALAAYRAGAAALGPTGDPALDQAVAVAVERLAGIDRVLGAAGVRTVRDRELRLLQPDPDLGAARDLGAWRDGLAVRAGALRRLERTVAGDLDAAAPASLRQRERRLRDRLVMAGVAVSPPWSRRRCSSGAWVAGRCGRGRRPGRPCPAWPAAARRWPTASSSCSRTWSGTSPTRYAARACSGSTTSPPGCAAPPRPCSP
jgi:hypothetical protein